jgi:hypothetical protein
MHIYIFINYASQRQSQKLLYLLSLGFESLKPEIEPNRIDTESVSCWVEIDVAKPESKSIRIDSFRDVVAETISTSKDFRIFDTDVFFSRQSLLILIKSFYKLTSSRLK